MDFHKMTLLQWYCSNLKFTDAATGYDGRSLYNQYYNQQTQDNRISHSHYL